MNSITHISIMDCDLGCAVADQIKDYEGLMKRIRRYYRKLLLADGNFSHAAMARCFFFLRRLMEVSPDDYKYSEDYIVNVRQLFTIIGNLMEKYCVFTGRFPYCNDLHELLVKYVELECLVYCKSTFDLHNQSDIEDNIIQTLRYMLTDKTATPTEDIKNTEDACVLRCLYTVKMVSLKIRFLYPLIENIARKLSEQLEQIKLYDENAMDDDEAESSMLDGPYFSSISSFLKKCDEISRQHLYYFDSNDEAEAEELQPIYKSAGTTKMLKDYVMSSALQRPLIVTLGVVTDSETVALMENYRSRFCQNKIFEYQEFQKVSDKKMSNLPVIVLDESDDDSDNECSSYKRHKGEIERSSPISISSYNEDSVIIESADSHSTPFSSFLSDNVIDSSLQMQTDMKESNNSISFRNGANNNKKNSTRRISDGFQSFENGNEFRMSNAGVSQLCSNLKEVAINKRVKSNSTIKDIEVIHL